MLKPLLAVMGLLVSLAAGANDEISDLDAAIYELVRPSGQPTGMQVRLMHADGSWTVQGKEGEASWKSIGCDNQCDYRASTRAERRKFLSTFPTEIRKHFKIACIQNSTSAFCRLSRKDDPSRGGYALIALVTGRPVPLSLRRVARP